MTGGTVNKNTGQEVSARTSSGKQGHLASLSVRLRGEGRLQEEGNLRLSPMEAVFGVQINRTSPGRRGCNQMS